MNLHHVAARTLFPAAVLCPSARGAQQELQHHATKVCSSASPSLTALQEVTLGRKEMRHKQGSCFMIYTAVERAQNVTLRVQCYDCSPFANWGVGTWNTTANPLPAKIHNINCTELNSDTQDESGNCIIFPPLSTGINYFCFQRRSVPSRVKLAATAFILCLVLKNAASFSALLGGLEAVWFLQPHQLAWWKTPPPRTNPSQISQHRKAELQESVPEMAETSLLFFDEAQC